MARAGPIHPARPQCDTWERLAEFRGAVAARAPALVRPFGGTELDLRRGGRPGAEDRGVVRAARVPEHPGLDPELLGRADLLAHVSRRVARRAQRERLKVRP